ncbi:hypothetical protein ACLB2K_007725 [Fragaria x ananassa]
MTEGSQLPQLRRQVLLGEILKHLLNDTDFSSEENVSIISIVGLGGLGKTTLAKLVYNESMVKENFEKRMWICVSDNFDIQTLVRGITSAAGEPKCEDESSDIMETKLQDTLRDKKFLLVLDDVWDTESIGVTRETWIALKPLLNVGGNGSKIIVTTRNNQVASIVNSSYKHSLEDLSQKDCMPLFIQRAFNRGEEQRYPNSIEIGKDIVNKCGGVPLAVATFPKGLCIQRRPSRFVLRKSDLEVLPPSAKVLQSIELADCDNLTEIPKLQKFTFLEQLRIDNCSNLLALSEGLHCLSELEIIDCPKLSKSCERQLKGEDWSKFTSEANIKIYPDVDTDEDDDDGAFDDHNAIPSYS